MSGSLEKPIKRAIDLGTLCFAVSLGTIVADPSLFAREAMAQPTCGDFYRIKRGDTLRSITLQNLGHDRYAVLFRANRDILPRPEKIVAGQLIYIPCAGDRVQTRSVALVKAGRRPNRRDNQGDRWSLQRDTAPNNNTGSVTVVTPNPPETATLQTVAVARQNPEEPADKALVKGRELLLLTASGLGALVGEDLPDGGLLTKILEHALRAKGENHTLKTAFVDDRRAHLNVLMPTGAFDLAYPWPAPDCTAAPRTAQSKRLCRDFVFSRPLYQIETVVLAPRDSPLVQITDPAALNGRRICGPEGFPTVDTETARWPAELVEARTPVDCLEMVRLDQADMVSLPAPWAEEAEEKGFARAAALTRSIPIHAAAWRDNPGTASMIDDLNKGLVQLQQSGRWFTMVSGYLSAYNRATAQQN